MPDFGEGIFQRAAAVPQGGPSHTLGAMEMPQSHIVKRGKQRGRNLIHAPHRPLLRFTGHPACDKLVGQKNVSPSLVHRPLPQRVGHRLFVGGNVCLGVPMADQGRLQVRQGVNGDIPILVLEEKRRLGPLILGRQMNALPCQEPGGKGQPFRTVMVSRDGKNRNPSAG